MTAPTIEQIFILMQQQLQIAADSFRNEGLAIDADDCEEILAKSKTATQSANTLPLDEVPEGWRISQIAYYSNSNNADLYICDLIRRADAELVCSNAMPTPAEALRAAIAKAKTT